MKAPTTKGVPTEHLIQVWDQHDAQDIDIGFGMDHESGQVCMGFDRFVRLVWFDDRQLRQFIAALQQQEAKLRDVLKIRRGN